MAKAPAFVGQRLRRKEDHRLLRGGARHVGDMRMAGMLHARILRSPLAHGRITRLDASGALELPGVVGVFTAADLAGKVGPFVEAAREEISPLLLEKVSITVKPCPMPVLAEGEVFWVGQPVAVLVAEDRYAAEDALERVEVDYDPLPVVPDADAALREGAPVLHPELGDNVVVHFRVGAGEVDTAFAAAPHLLRERFVMGRQLANAMETRGVLAEWDAEAEELLVWCTNARPHLVRRVNARMLDLPLERVRVVAPDMGGSFGTGLFPEDVLIPFLAMELGRPVRWVEDRQENLANTRHGRDQIHDVEVAYDDDGRILAIRDRYLVDSGAYNPYAITVSYNTAAHLRGQYRIDTFSIEARNVVTNKAPVTPVRGAGRPEAVFAMERCLELVAERLGRDPLEVRRRNLIPADAMPYPMGMPYRDGVDITYDSGDFPAQLEAALDAIGYDRLRDEQARLREEGRHLGIGVASYVEGSGFGPKESALVRLEPGGDVLVVTGAKPHGQGLETTLAQVCADELGVPPERITVRGGDTSQIDFGIGTFASRSAVTAGSAVGVAAQRLKAAVLEAAGAILRVDPGGLDVREGAVVGEGRSISLEQVAAVVEADGVPGVKAPLEVRYDFEPPTVTFASGTHAVAVEVDPETGFVRLLRYVTVDDCGRMLNPTIVEGQIHGGVAHGIGNALYEEAAYDPDGQLLTGTYMDYLLPTAAEVPPIRVEHQEFLSGLNPFGIKGCGEGGAVAPPAAVANAVVDALRPLPINITRMPLHPQALLDLIEEARRRAGDG